MRRLPFRLVNVFSLPGDPFSGNPLCVFEDGRSLAPREMQALARQTNLSETTFVLSGADSPDSHAAALVRIFTPTHEMPFAGHPTLGTAHVVAARRSGADAADRVVLELPAGMVHVTRAADDLWTLEAPRSPKTRAPSATPTELARMVGAPALGGVPLWVDTGVEQLVVPLATAEDVRRATPSAALLDELAAETSGDKRSVYVWARAADGKVLARYFFLQHGGVTEDPATGSACANLGGWLVSTGAEQPATLEVEQGELIGRPSSLRLRVESGRVFVGGRVSEVGRGEVSLP
jgi:trans-2,3-dihydro-3-hydroxyanthranilate isomerase